MTAARAAEIIRYLVTGTLSVGLNLLIILVLTEEVGLNYRTSITVCFVTVTFVSFCLNRFWTFRKREQGAPRDLMRYVLVTLTQLPLSLAACSFAVEFLNLPYVAAAALSSVVFAPTTYLVHRIWSFGLGRGNSLPNRQGEQLRPPT
jgi:putative flippase GtrA